MSTGGVQRFPTPFRIKELTRLAAKYGNLALLEPETLKRMRGMKK